VIDAVAWPGPRTLLQGLWIVAALVVLAVVQLWLIASCLSFLAITAVGSLAWFSQPAMVALPLALWAHIAPAYHTVFRYAAYLAGGLPFLAVVYGATVGRLRNHVVPVEVPIRDLPPQLNGLRIVHLSDIQVVSL
jgi:hypothetical protein